MLVVDNNLNRLLSCSFRGGAARHTGSPGL